MKKLAIIGASGSQIPLVLKAKEMGIENHCFAWDRGKDSVCKGIADFYHPISTSEKDEILEICKKIGIDGVTAIACDPSMPTVGYVAQHLNLPGNTYEDSLVATNKYQQRQAFLKNGVRPPRFTMVHKDMDLTGFNYPLMVKPTDCCASIGVMKVDREEDLQQAIRQAQQTSFSKEVIIEEYVSGNESTVDSISWNGKHYFLTITDTVTTGSPYYQEIAYHQPSQANAAKQAEILAETRKALDAINFKYGASDVELKINENGEVFVIEINPRMGSDNTEILLELSTGYDFVKGVIDVALGQFEPPKLTEQKYSGVYFLSQDTSHVKQIIENKESEPEIVDARITSNELHSLLTNPERDGYFIYQSAQKRRWGDY